MGRWSELDRLLAYMEDHICKDHLDDVEQLHYDTIQYRDVGRLPLTIHTGQDSYRRIPLDIACQDPEKMLYNEILLSAGNSAYNSVRIKDDSPLMIRGNFGNGIIASLFGCRVRLSEGQLPSVQPISMEKAKRVFSEGIPTLNRSLAEEVFETYHYYRERLKDYPKCSRYIHLTQPEMAGPYDTLNLIVGNEGFILPYRDPELTRTLIDVIALTCIAFRKWIDPCLSDRMHNDAVFVRGFCMGGKILINANTGTANLSPEVYQLCEGEPDFKIMEAFCAEGGGSLHYCGGFKSWHHEKIINPFLRCIHFGNPERHDLKTEYGYLKERRIGIVGWEMNHYQDIRTAIRQGDSGAPIRTGLTLTCKTSNIKQGIETAKRHREISAMNCFQ